MAKRKQPAFDGLGEKEKKNLKRVVRQAWSWSTAWRLCKKRSMHKDGFPRCENKKCQHRGKAVPKVFVDHIKPCGEVASPGWLDRMYVPSKRLQNLCKQCHDAKTKKEKQQQKRKAIQNDNDW